MKKLVQKFKSWKGKEPCSSQGSSHSGTCDGCGAMITRPASVSVVGCQYCGHWTDFSSTPARSAPESAASGRPEPTDEEADDDDSSTGFVDCSRCGSKMPLRLGMSECTCPSCASSSSIRSCCACDTLLCFDSTAELVKCGHCASISRVTRVASTEFPEGVVQLVPRPARRSERPRSLQERGERAELSNSNGQQRSRAADARYAHAQRHSTNGSDSRHACTQSADDLRHARAARLETMLRAHSLSGRELWPSAEAESEDDADYETQLAVALSLSLGLTPDAQASQAASQAQRAHEVHQARHRIEAAARPLKMHPSRFPVVQWNAQDDAAQEHNDESAECSICMEEYNVGDMIKTLPCCHRFHSKCVDSWLGRSSLCPMCDTDVLHLNPISMETPRDG